VKEKKSILTKLLIGATTGIALGMAVLLLAKTDRNQVQKKGSVEKVKKDKLFI